MCRSRSTAFQSRFMESKRYAAAWPDFARVWKFQIERELRVRHGAQLRQATISHCRHVVIFSPWAMMFSPRGEGPTQAAGA
jgi:hypothetical protein